MYECGDYRLAGDLLAHYRVLTLDTEKAFSALWGKLACDVLLNDWEKVRARGGSRARQTAGRARQKAE